MPQTPAYIEIYSDGNIVRINKTGERKHIAAAVETAAFADPVFRASCICAVAEMFRHKHPDLFMAILEKMDYTPISEAGREAQQARIQQILTKTAA